MHLLNFMFNKETKPGLLNVRENRTRVEHRNIDLYLPFKYHIRKKNVKASECHCLVNLR